MNLDLALGGSSRRDPERWLPSLLIALSVAWLVFSLARLVWSFFPEPSSEGFLSGASSLPRPPVASVPRVALGNFHLFGWSAARLDVPVAPDAPETQLKLKLIGTVAGRDPKLGVALIADEAGKQDEYEAGEPVGGAVVDAIYKDRVVLLANGRLETLKLPRLSQLAATPSVAPTAAPLPGMAVSVPTVNVSVPNADPSNGFVNPTAGASSAGFAAAREQAMANPAGLISMVQPVLDANGNLSGIKLNGGANQALLTQAGIQPNDVVVAVNGQRIDSLERGQQIATSLASATEVSVTVRREGREVTLPAVRFR